MPQGKKKQRVQRPTSIILTKEINLFTIWFLVNFFRTKACTHFEIELGKKKKVQRPTSIFLTKDISLSTIWLWSISFQRKIAPTLKLKWYIKSSTLTRVSAI